MTSRLLRVPLENLTEGERALPKEAALYVTRVHRLGPGDALIAFDPSQRLEADATLLPSEPGQPVRVRLTVPRPARLVATRPVILLQALSKADKVDAVVRDATELGATQIFPVIAERSITIPKDAAARRARFQKIATEAARQCGRGDAPAVHPVMPLREALTEAASLVGARVHSGAEQNSEQPREPIAAQPKPLCVCLAPGATTQLGDMLCTIPPTAPFALVVGPEGGLSPAEIAACEASGFHNVSLGPFVLRTETVCAAVLGALLLSRGCALPA